MICPRSDNKANNVTILRYCILSSSISFWLPSAAIVYFYYEVNKHYQPTLFYMFKNIEPDLQYNSDDVFPFSFNIFD